MSPIMDEYENGEAQRCCLGCRQDIQPRTAELAHLREILTSRIQYHVVHNTAT